MTEFVDANVQNALLTKLTSPSLGYPYAYPYIPYVPSEGQAYMEAQPILKAQTQHPGLGYSDSNLGKGIFQVDAVIPDGIGEPTGLRMQALIAERFAIGTTLIAGTRKVWINSPPQTAAGIKDGAWVRFPVSIAFTIIT
jgi:Bacteriophage related domain of unknown function